jgi:hypothetical protein|tara:strand:+ start:2457 stop:2600 length:144 start_codon:yes stop_codon:yes gene_type:complete
MKSKISKDESKKLVREWKQHLQNSRLTEQQQIKRAKEFSRKGMKPKE